MVANKIDHIVLLMMENRSFDHYLGALNFDIDNPTHQPRLDVNGLAPNDVSKTPLPTNRYLDSSANDPPVEPWCMDPELIVRQTAFPDPPHEWESVRAAWNNGQMDGFVRAYQDAYRRMGATAAQHALQNLPTGVIYELPYATARCVMGYYTRKTLEVLYGLTDQFTLCDNWFASFLGSTHPNRVFANAGHCGQVLHTGLASAIARKPPPVWDTWEQTNTRGNKISWKYYLPASEMLSTFLLWLGFYNHHEKQAATFKDFCADCDNGTLPQVSIVEPPYSIADDHPTHDPRRGQAFLRMVVDNLRKSPCWDTCALILTYDEHGGFFDHVAPPLRSPSASRPLDYLGVRVPAVVISPYAKRMKAVHDLFDHRSILKSIAERWDLDLPDLSEWQGGGWNGVQSIWNSCFDFAAAPLAGSAVTLPPVRLADWTAKISPEGQLEPRSDLAETFVQMARLENLAAMRDMLG